MKKADKDHEVLHPPPTAYEAMQKLFPDLKDQVESAARRYRSRKPSQAVPPEELAEDPALTQFLESYALFLVEHQRQPSHVAMESADLLGTHLFYMVNFESHHRKTFWVEESLAWMFRQTRLDIEGECLRLPFQSCAFVYTDQPTLEMAQDFLVKNDPSNHFEELKILTVHLTEIPERDSDALIVNVSLLFDEQTGDWPYLVARDLYFHPRDSLEAILDSHCPEVPVNSIDPIFTSLELKEILHVVINSVLYATSSHVDMQLIESPVKSFQKSLARKGPKKRKKLERRLEDMTRIYSADDIFFLPGKIDISQYRRLSGLEKTREGAKISTRFMVRGHWRQANPNWTDQRLRWIEPYWKGPEKAIPVDKEYRLKP